MTNKTKLIIYTDGSKVGNKVGAGAAIYVDRELIKRCKYKLNNCCTHNQAEQLAILKALEEISTIPDCKYRKAAIYTDSQVTIDSIRNNSIHTPIIADIRKKVKHLITQNWTIHFSWIKACTGIEGNELADKLAKEAAEDTGNLKVEYYKIPIKTVATELKKHGIAKWQRHWESTGKGALCRSFFSEVQQRLQVRIPITAAFKAIVTGHGKKKSIPT